MNQLTIIGNLCHSPELRTTDNGISVCSFTVAVNRRSKSSNPNQPEADFFRVSAWRELGENCQKYLEKGRKVAVVGPVSVRAYEGKDGTAKASLEVTAQNVEFLSSKGDAAGKVPEAPKAAEGYTEVDGEDLPF